MAFKHLTSPILVLSWLLIASYGTVEGQIISTPCTGSMITSFTPCVNFLTNSSSNGTSPTEDGCSALRTMMTNSTNCLCLIVTGGIPFQMPMNPNIAMSLPSACNMPGVPLKCKAPSPPAVVAPAPRSDAGPAGAPNASPTAAPTSPPRNPKDSTSPPPSPSTSTPPPDEIPSLTPPSPPADSSTPATNSGSQTPVTPSAAPSFGHGISTIFLLAAFGAIVLSLY